jgi:hypothetical protein
VWHDGDDFRRGQRGGDESEAFHSEGPVRLHTHTHTHTHTHRIAAYLRRSHNKQHSPNNIHAAYTKHTRIPERISLCRTLVGTRLCGTGGGVEGKCGGEVDKEPPSKVVD